MLLFRQKGKVMENLRQPMTFKRLDQDRVWPFGYPEKAMGLPSSLSLVPALHTLRLDFSFLFREFCPYNKIITKVF